MLARMTFFAIALCGASRAAFACSCIQTGPLTCLPGNDPGVVFVGLVTSTETKTARAGSDKAPRLRAQLRVEEALSGIDATAVDVDTSASPGSCGVAFEIGERYLVYAIPVSADSWAVKDNPWPKPALLTAGACGGTRLLDESLDDEIELLRAQKLGRPLTRIFGSVSLWRRGDGSRPLDGWTIVVEGETDRREARTDASGRYRIDGLSAGSHAVSLRAPEAYRELPDLPTKPRRLEITAPVCGFEQSFHLRAGGRIGGRVTDEQGVPVDGVEVSLLIPGADEYGAIRAVLPRPTAKGRYEFSVVPAGEYLIGVNVSKAPDRDNPWAPLYYPAASHWKQAVLLKLDDSKILGDVDVQLGPRLSEATLSGMVVHGDGRPAAGARVIVSDAEHPYAPLQLAGDVLADTEGRFKARCFMSRRYVLQAWTAAGYASRSGARSEAVEVDTGTDPLSVSLVIRAQPRK